jgi:hypothetical protein
MLTENQLLWRVPAILKAYVNTPESRAWLEDFYAVQLAKRMALEAGNGTQQPVGVVAATSSARALSDG